MCIRNLEHVTEISTQQIQQIYWEWKLNERACSKIFLVWKIFLKDQALLSLTNIQNSKPFLNELWTLTISGALYLWADFSPVFRNSPSMEEASQIFDKMIDSGIYIPYSKGFNGNNPIYFRIIYSIPQEYLVEAMTRFRNFVEMYTAAW